MPSMHFKDDSWNFWVMYERLENQFKEHKTLIIAYDLDDTVRPYRSSTCKETIAVIKRCERLLHPIFIVYTANPDIEQAKIDLEKMGLPYDAINDYPQGTMPAPLWKVKQDNSSIKLYYNILLDDKSFGLRDSCRALTILCNKVESAFGTGSEFDTAYLYNKHIADNFVFYYVYGITPANTTYIDLNQDYGSPIEFGKFLHNEEDLKDFVYEWLTENEIDKDKVYTFVAQIAMPDGYGDYDY